MPLMLINKEWYLEYRAEMEEVEEKVTIDATFSLGNLAESEDILSISKDKVIIKIEGPMSRNGPSNLERLFGFEGTAYTNIIEAVATIKKEVKKGTPVNLEMNTPGGNIDGVDEAFQALESLKGDYPLTAINKGMITSAGTWLASAADRVVATSPTAINGSIGVITVGYDDTKALENEGFTRHVITNHEAKKKAPGFETEEGRETIQTQLDAVYDVFKGRVTAGFNISEKQIDGLQGRVILAKEALEIGLLDEIIDSQSNSGLTQKTPANAGTKGHAMSLKELLAEHPAAAAEVEKLKTEAFKAGKQEVETKIKSLSVYLAKDSGYPDAIKSLVLKAINGDGTTDTVTGAIVAYDALREEKTSAAAKDDSDEILPTPPKAPEGSTDGTISTEADFEKAVEELRGEA
jgi:ClpP class serine protease